MSALFVSHYPSPRTKLASLVKGRWLDGTTQTVALLRPACDMSVLFILQTFLPSRRRDCLSCIDPLHPHNHCKKTIVPCSAPHSCHMNALLVSHPCETLGVQLRASMPVPSKGEVLSPEKIRATTGGIATPPFLTLRTNPKHYTKIGHKGAERQGI